MCIRDSPEDVLLDEKLLSELRGRGFEVMLYEDPFAFRAEYEERYRAAWDRGEQGPAPSLVLHPVSYTHLDVYKRQPSSASPTSCQRKRCKRTRSC